METSRLTIGCVAAQYLVSAKHPSPQHVKDRLDAVIARELPRSLAQSFNSWFSESDQSIWIIRQLNIETAINVTGDPEHITRALTTQIAKNLGETFQDENQDSVRHFPSRAAYLASFLSDLAFGTAWSQWHYQSFEGLRALPVSAALRTAICDDIAIGKIGLSLLGVGNLKKVVTNLTLQDARRVLEAIALESPMADVSPCYEAVVGAAIRNAASLDDLADESQRGLYLFVSATDDAKGSGGALKHAALKVARHKDSWSKAAAVPDALGHACQRSTAFGGIFLILPHLDELPLVEATRDWPHADEAATVSLVRFLTLLKSCGRENSGRAFYDPLLRDLLLIPPTLSPEALRTWQSQLKREHLQHFLTTLLEWQISRGAISGKEQLLTVSNLRGCPLLVLIDADRGLWLLVDKYLSHPPHKIIEALRLAVAMLPYEQGILYCDPSLILLLQAKFAGLNIVDASDHAIDLAEAKMRGADAILARLDNLPDELEFLALPASFKIARPLDLVLSIAAQHLLRGIAWRLPSFARSNLPYLSRNFLDFSASIVEEDPARRVVRLGRPPLHLVLNVTGMTRQNYQLSWLDERPFALFEGE